MPPSRRKPLAVGLERPANGESASRELAETLTRETKK
jgi:hypothetical protein